MLSKGYFHKFGCGRRRGTDTTATKWGSRPNLFCVFCVCVLLGLRVTIGVGLGLVFLGFI